MQHDHLFPRRLWLQFACWALCFCVLTVAPVLALDPSMAVTQYGLSSWQTDNGLPQSSVNAIVQTPDGYLWFGTQEGLARFDGVRFTIFDKRSTPAMSTHHISALLVSHDGSLWIGRNNGLTRYKNGLFTSYSSRDGLRDGFIWSLAEGVDGSIWMATYTHGLYRFHHGKFTSYSTADGLGASSVWATYVTRDGTLWAGTNGGGLSRFSRGKFTNITTREGLANNIVWAIDQDRRGDLWIGTNDGLSRLHDGKITNFTTANGLSNNCIKAIREDRDGNLWIGTEGGGLDRYSNGAFTSLGLQEGLSDDSVLSLFEDREGSLWAGTSAGGVNQLRQGKFRTITRSEGLIGERIWAVREARDGSFLIGTNAGFSRWKNGKATNLTTREGLSSNVVRSVLEDRDGSVWLGTSDGLDRYDHGKVTVYKTSNGLPLDMIRALTQDREGNIWIGTRGGGVARLRDGVFTVFNSKNGLANDIVASVDEDLDGSLWIATNGGLSVLKDGVFRNYGVHDGLSNNVVRVTYHGHDGAHWIGTYGGGLNRLKNGRITPIRSSDGLFDDVVFAILEDDQGYLWMTCNRGVFRVRKQELDDFADGRIKSIHSESFNVEDGLKSNECNGGYPAGWKGRDGRLFFPTIRGVAFIDPNHMRRNDVAPAVWNEEVLLDGRPVATPSTELVVGPGRHSLEIRYTALSFIAPRRVAFRYRLKGFSEEWVEAGNRRSAFYTGLPPGTYVFEAMASNNDGLWRVAQNPLHLRIQAAFFQTWWFYSACAAALLLVIGASVRMRMSILKSRERLLVRLVDEQTAQLRDANAELTAAKEAAEDVAEINVHLSRHKQLILNSAGEGIFGLDAHGVATFINPSAARVLGWTVEELVGRDLHQIIHHETTGAPGPQDECIVCSATLASARVGLTAAFRHRAGTTIPVEYTASTIIGEGGTTTGVVVTFRDVSERLEVERMKDEFVSTVSHELRTPLTSIRGALGLLLSGMLGDVAEKGQRMLAIAVANTDRLVRLINDILDLERIDSGKMELIRTSVEVRELMTEACDGVQPMAAQAGVELAIEHLPALLSVDRDRILQVLTNLLSNAIKFSPPGTTVTVGGAVLDEMLILRVADQGRGVPKDKLQSIFERFKQVNASDSRDKGGTGLGLAICRSIISAHGGAIWAESIYGKGSVFQFTVPLHAGGAKAAPFESSGDGRGVPSPGLETTAYPFGVERTSCPADARADRALDRKLESFAGNRVAGR